MIQRDIQCLQMGQRSLKHGKGNTNSIKHKVPRIKYIAVSSAKSRY